MSNPTASQGTALDPARVASTTVEPYPHQVKVTCNGEILARSTRALLLREGYAPVIYFPPDDVELARLERIGVAARCPYKGGAAARYAARIGSAGISDVAWCYESPTRLTQLAGHFAFDFDKVTIEVDGQRVRGHVRDPHKVISVRSVPERLRLAVGERVVVDSTAALVLSETGLPDRYYVPSADVDPVCLEPSDRRSVCTYKGEATYWHLDVEGARHENVVWSYPEPWVDFSPDVGRIVDHYGLYTSTFDRHWLGELEQRLERTDRDADRRMIESPTIDRDLRERIGA